MSEDDPRRVVSDTGPLISLEKIAGGHRFIRRLYDGLVVPPAVLRELAAGAFESEAAYLRHYEIEDLIAVQSPSEREAETMGARQLDEGEQAGREVAREMGVPISGIAGQLLRAVRKQAVAPEEAEGMLVQLRAAGRINRQVFEAVRCAMGEEG